MQAKKLKSYGANELVRGFTLLEVMIVVAILAVVMGATVSSGFNFYTNQSLNGERDGLVSLLRHARGRAMNNTNQSSHGVYVSTSTNQYILFQGASYASRATDYDLPFPKSPSITFTGPAEILFAALTGTSSASGTITLSGNAGSVSVFVNGEGRVSW
jgi:prepilin-type N-terminal cleavage/methylation domain-containing protein